MRPPDAISAAFVAALLASTAHAALPQERPELGKTVLVERVSGAVLVEQPGARRFTAVHTPVLLAVGGSVDVTRGRARLLAAQSSGSTSALARGLFYGGRFVVTQTRRDRAAVRLTLAGGDFTGCPVAPARRRQAASVVRHLWADTKGKFQTVGRYGAAEVRGTRWLTADRCDGTFALSARGAVTTTSRDARITRILQPGQSIVYFCKSSGVPGATGDYCVVLWLQPDIHAQGFALGDFYSAGLAAMTDITSYSLCVTPPGGSESCTTYPLSARDPLGFARSEVTCTAPAPGTYVIRWLIGSAQLGPAITFTATRSPPPGVGGCSAATS